MGKRMMKNLEMNNILCDDGEVSINAVKEIEKLLFVNFPSEYVNFISKHNTAYLKADVFDYDDPNRSDCFNSDGITFIDITKIFNHIENIKSGEEPDWPIEYRFEDGLIPFGDNGGGDMICFDYRNDKTTDDPPIVIWNHDMGLKHRVVFIANNFEEFINMLHESED